MGQWLAEALMLGGQNWSLVLREWAESRVNVNVEVRGSAVRIPISAERLLIRARGS